MNESLPARRIIIPGGSGQVGTLLARAFHQEGHDVVVLSRRPAPAPWRVVAWDAHTLGDWAKKVDGAAVVINLAGRSVNCRYRARERREILESRVQSTRLVGQAIARATSPPAVWLQASTATIYAHRFDAPNDERNGILGGREPGVPDTWRFSIDVALAWEQALNEAQTPHTRKVALRSAMTMSPDAGGVFDVLLGLVRRGLGGHAGDGRQYVSWIHEIDFIRAVRWLIEHEYLDGPVNLAAPQPLPNADFMRGVAGSVGHSLRPARDAVDAGGGRVPDADGDGAGAEEPARRPRALAGGRVRVSVPALGGSGARPVPPLARAKGRTAHRGTAAPGGAVTIKRYLSSRP